MPTPTLPPRGKYDVIAGAKLQNFSHIPITSKKKFAF